METPPPSSPEQEQTHLLTVFSVSAGMVGVCLTAIGLIQVVINGRQVSTLCDDLLVADSLLFLMSCLTSYIALNHRSRSHYRRLKLAVDTLLTLGILLMVVVCGMIAWTLIE